MGLGLLSAPAQEINITYSFDASDGNRQTISKTRFFGTYYAKYNFIYPITYTKRGFPYFNAQFMSNELIN